MLDNDTWRGTFQAQSHKNNGALAVADPGMGHPTMRLWVMDAWVRDGAVLIDRRVLRTIMYDAAEAGGVTVLGEEFCDFDNGAVTGVLVLAQSHLSIHTWPEFSLANVDILTYGELRGEEIMHVIGERLDAERVNVTCVLRALG